MTAAVSNPAMSRNEDVEIPLRFLTELLPQIADLTELHVTLAAFRIASRSRFDPPAAGELEVLADPVLAQTFQDPGKGGELPAQIRRGLQYAVARESLMQVQISSDSERTLWFVPDLDDYRRRLRAAQLDGRNPFMRDGDPSEPVAIQIARPSIFTVYERNIGLLTPLLTEQIVAAMDRYPINWIEDAIGEAVGYNKRNWRYIQRILENWATSGRGERLPGRNAHEANRRGVAELLNPDQYREGRYLRRARKP